MRYQFVDVGWLTAIERSTMPGKMQFTQVWADVDSSLSPGRSARPFRKSDEELLAWLLPEASGDGREAGERLWKRLQLYLSVGSEFVHFVCPTHRLIVSGITL
jgi:hypothetical protein